METEIESRATIAALLCQAMGARSCEGWRLARHVGVHPAQVSRWRSGEQGMPAPALVRAARYLRAPALLAAHPVARALAEEWAAPADFLAHRARRCVAPGREETVGRVVVVDGRVEIRMDADPDMPPPTAPAMRLRSVV